MKRIREDVRIFWLDANVYIQATNGPYRFDVAPKFWTILSQQLDAGVIKSPRAVYDEIADGKDQLANWFKQRRGNGLRTDASREVQARFGEIAAYVATNFKPHQMSEFLKGADGWVIAHALEGKGYVVTQESVRSRKSKIKIPTICKVFNVPYMSTYDMLSELKVKLS